MSGLLINVLLLGGLLVLSGLLSGAETAFFRLQSRIKDYGEDVSIHKSILVILQRPRHLLISLLTGNTLVNIAMAFVAALLTADIALRLGLNLSLLLVIESIVVTTVILLFGEITPKLLAIRHTTAFARLASRPVKVLVMVLYPVGRLIYGFTHLVTQVLRIRPEKMFTSEEELKNLAEVGLDRGTLAQSETEIIHSIFDFGDTAVHEIMVPRVDILALEARSGPEQAQEMIRTRQVSKIPIYKESIDDIRGILYAKDILPYLDGTHPEVNLIRLSRPPFFVPESKGVASLLQDFKDRRTSIAIVVDEFGGTAGLVTLEDVVEEVLGELRDPFDLEEAEIRSAGHDEFLVDAGVALDDLGDRLGHQFPTDREYDTLGGFLFDRFDKIPSVGQWITDGGRRFTVKALEGNRIAQVHISARNIETEDDPNET
ncbi:MAG: HlyC/CorC family transporter [Fidelibacterota bacterium]|nr:MAG: HlyC/CorC family transporter [Candidatus Neomarinimicrobiota bacterium]